MAQLTGPVTITGVVGKTINTKNGPGTIYEVSASDGNKYATFTAPLAQKANSMIGQTVALSFTTRQNGQYVNYSLQDIVDGGAAAPAAIPMEPAAAAIPVAAPAAPAPAPAAILVAGGGDKDARITRLSAAKTAFDYAASAGMDEQASFALAARIESFANGQPPAPVAAAPVAPAQAADDGIPWD